MHFQHVKPVPGYPAGALWRPAYDRQNGLMLPTPKIITVRRVISRETIERLYTEDEISKLIYLGAQFGVKPEANWFFCVFVFSVARESPSMLRITTVSTTVTRTHKYTITPGLLQLAPEITPKEEHSIWVDVLRAHFRAEDRLLHRKMNTQEISEYTRYFMDNGAAEGEPLEFVIRDLDYDLGKEKPGPFLVQ
jgi:hypothetical protein